MPRPDTSQATQNKTNPNICTETITDTPQNATNNKIIHNQEIQTDDVNICSINNTPALNTIKATEAQNDDMTFHTMGTNTTTPATSLTTTYTRAPPDDTDNPITRTTMADVHNEPTTDSKVTENNTTTDYPNANTDHLNDINIVEEPNYNGYEPDNSSDDPDDSSDEHDNSSDESDNSNTKGKLETFLDEGSKINFIHSNPDIPTDKESPQQYNNSKGLQVCQQILIELTNRYIKTLHTELLLTLLFTSYFYLGEPGIIVFILLITAYKTYRFFETPSNNVINEINTHPTTPTDTNQKASPPLIDLDVIDEQNTHQQSEPIFLRDLPSLVPLSTKYLCKGKINGVSVRFEVDSGACCSVLTSNIFELIKHNNNLKKIQGGTLTDFQGNALQGDSMYQLNISLNNVAKAAHTFAVVENRRAHALLGVDFLRSKRIDVINTGPSPYLQFTRNNVTRKIFLDSEQSIHSLNMVEIESGETKNVLMTIKSINKHTVLPHIKTGIAKMLPQEHLLLPKEGLVQIQTDGTFPIPITNTGFGPITILPKEQYGSFESLPQDTLLQNTKTNEFEQIDNTCNTQINLIDFPQDNFSLNPPETKQTTSITLYFTLPNKPPHHQPLQTSPATISLIVSDTGETDNLILTTKTDNPHQRINLLISKHCQEKVLNIQFWTNLFSNLSKPLTTHTGITIDASNLNPISINNCRLGFATSFKNTKTLIIKHEPLQINKIRCGSDDDSDSTFSEDDLVEDLFYKIRIPDSKTVWTQVLQDVPTHLQDKVFYLLTQKHQKIVSKNSTDFGECTVEGSDFRIDLTSDVPFTAKPYPLNSVYQQQVDETVQEMIAANLLIEESSNYGTGVFIRGAEQRTNLTDPSTDRPTNGIQQKRIHAIGPN